MKKFLCVVLAFMMFVSVPLNGFAEEKGKNISDAVIVISSEASETDAYAAKMLKKYLDKIVGGNVSVVTDETEASAYEICVGSTNRTDWDSSDCVDGSYIIRSSDENIIICGSGNKGTINGVYAFLEKYCGCHWYESEIIVVPDNTELSVPDNIDLEYTPYFEYTEADTVSACDAEFSIANGLVGGVYRKLTPEQGSTVGYLGRFAHTLTTQFCKSEMYFEEHPEYFALRNGIRTPNQLCLTNEKVKEIVASEVLELLETDHNPDADIQIVSLTQHDNFDYCTCENCSAVDQENGSQSGTMISFVNDIAARVKAHGYDNVVFDTFAYQYTRKAPSVVRPREDVIVRLCSIECCFGHTLDDPDCEQNIDFMNDLKEWGKICNRIYIWDYVNNYRETLCVFPNFGVMQRNVQIFYENNAKGLYEEGNYYISTCDGEFGEMRTYLLAKLMQNPYLDYDAEMNGYLNGVYGPGGCYIREFIDIITEHAVTDDKHLTIYQTVQDTLYDITDEEIERCNELWQMAKDAAQTDEQLQQIRRSELSWTYWKNLNMRGEFSRNQFPYIYMKAGEDFHKALKEMGVEVFSEGGRVGISDCELLYLYRPANKWGLIYEEWFWDILNPFAVGIYKILSVIYNVFR